ncbi:MAG TPA: ATP-dependent DNA helicase [Polyangiaceae bacterium]|nr:ATP-dependent DNA helicase [Polyangiaceae bacterium]
MSPSAAELLGPGGPLQSGLAGYEHRTGQLEMAVAVETALRDGQVLICEAGTGTGKTLAYLVPALFSGKKVVISTATRALQEQIFSKDLPLISRTLGFTPHAALMKGIGNYVCRRRHAEFRAGAEALRPEYSRALALLDDWTVETETGDLAELAGLREDDPIRAEIASSSDTRLGPACAYYDSCFVTRMKQEAEAASIVVVNHHLFFADLALRGPHPGRVLPDYDAVIFDEAHQLEDIATEFFGIRVSSSRIERLLRDAERAVRLGGTAGPLFGVGERLISAVQSAATELWRELGKIGRRDEPRITLERDVWAGPAQECWLDLDRSLDDLGALCRTERGRLSAAGGRQRGATAEEMLEITERRAELVREQLAAIVAGGPGRVTWLELGPRGGSLSSSPVDLSHLLRERIFESVPAVVLTSATLTTKASGDFSYLRSRLGIDGKDIAVEELCVSSPFDFERQSLLYTPRDLPAPNSTAFTSAAADRIAELCAVTRGGCFVLTTSLRSMRALHALLRQRLPNLRLLLQGEGAKSALISAFRADGNAVLVATMSFWEGVDVPGQALRLVVLEKIPFAVPSDPVVLARSRVAEEQGKNPFMELYVPAAAITLKQGFGRLIRSRSDRGIVTLLDERVHRKGYGKLLLASLPKARRTEALDDVKRFWSEGSES